MMRGVIGVSWLLHRMGSRVIELRWLGAVGRETALCVFFDDGRCYFRPSTPGTRPKAAQYLDDTLPYNAILSLLRKWICSHTIHSSSCLT